jgi:HdeA/HdeB family
MRYLIILVLLFFTMSALAAQPVDTSQNIANVIGTGQFSCGQFIEYRKQNNPQQQDLIVQWVWGFLSAYSLHGNFGTKWHYVPKISPPDSPTVLLYLENYCNKNPTNNVLQGSLSLIKKLGGSVVGY